MIRRAFNFNVEEWDSEGQHYETLAICRTLEAKDRPTNFSRLEHPTTKMYKPPLPARHHGGRVNTPT
jgi:hypothetical protein